MHAPRVPVAILLFLGGSIHCASSSRNHRSPTSELATSGGSSASPPPDTESLAARCLRCRSTFAVCMTNTHGSRVTSRGTARAGCRTDYETCAQGPNGDAPGACGDPPAETPADPPPAGMLPLGEDHGPPH